YSTVDGDVTPITARPEAGEENRRVRRAFSEKAATVGDRHALAGFKTNDHTRLDGQGCAGIDRNGISHHIMHARVPDRIDGDGAAHRNLRGLARAADDIGVSGVTRIIRGFGAIIIFLPKDGVAVRVVGDVGTDRRHTLPVHAVGRTLDHEAVFIVRVIDPHERDWIGSRTARGQKQRCPWYSADREGNAQVTAAQTSPDGWRTGGEPVIVRRRTEEE